MARYIVNTQFTFSGVFEVEANSREQARDIVMNDCGFVMGGSIHTTDYESVVDWDFNTHPEKETGRISKKK